MIDQMERENKQQTFVFLIIFDELWEQKVPEKLQRDQTEQLPLSFFKFVDNSN